MADIRLSPLDFTAIRDGEIEFVLRSGGPMTIAVKAGTKMFLVPTEDLKQRDNFKDGIWTAPKDTWAISDPTNPRDAWWVDQSQLPRLHKELLKLSTEPEPVLNRFQALATEIE